MIWQIEAVTEGREVYEVVASTEDEARRMFEEAETGEPVVSEVTGASIERVSLLNAEES